MKTTALLLACALSMGIYAQNDKQLHDFERDTIVLSQVVVTGTRTPKMLADAPVATRVISIDKTFSSDYAFSATLNGRLLSAVDNEEYRDYYDISQGTTTIHYPAYSLWKLMLTGRLWNRAKVSLTVDNLLNYKPDYYYLNAPITDGTNVMIGLGIELF